MKPARRRRRTELEAASALRWHDTIVEGPGVTAVSETEGAWCVYVIQAHHIVNQQVLRRRADELGLEHAVLLWDLRVGMKVSKRRHERHHSRHEPLRRDELPAGVLEFAAEYGLEPWLDRVYPPV